MDQGLNNGIIDDDEIIDHVVTDPEELTKLEPDDVFKSLTPEGESLEIHDDLMLIESKEETLNKLVNLYDNIHSEKGICKVDALSIEQYIPGFLNEDKPIEYFTIHPSATQLTTSLEELTNGIKAAIIAGIAVLIGIIIKIISWFKNKDTNDKPDLAKTTKEIKNIAKESDDVIKSSEELIKDARRLNPNSKELEEKLKEFNSEESKNKIGLMVDLEGGRFPLVAALILKDGRYFAQLQYMVGIIVTFNDLFEKMLKDIDRFVALVPHVSPDGPQNKTIVQEFNNLVIDAVRVFGFSHQTDDINHEGSFNSETIDINVSVDSVINSFKEIEEEVNSKITKTDKLDIEKLNKEKIVDAMARLIDPSSTEVSKYLLNKELYKKNLEKCRVLNERLHSVFEKTKNETNVDSFNKEIYQLANFYIKKLAKENISMTKLLGYIDASLFKQVTDFILIYGKKVATMAKEADTITKIAAKGMTTLDGNPIYIRMIQTKEKLNEKLDLIKDSLRNIK